MMRPVPLAGVLGDPIAHSRSPRLFATWLRRHGLPGHYVPLPVAAADLEGVLRALPRMGFVGVNVTLPHKEAALRLADTVTDRAALIGAANTLTFLADGRLHADNTDGHGFVSNLRHGAPEWRASSGPATVLGAGGAARAVVASLLEAGVPELRLANRTRARAEMLRDAFGSRVRVVEWGAPTEAALADAATIVNTTSLGMEGKAPLRLSLDGIGPGQVVTDIVYTPLETPLLAEARARGATTVDGLGMLLHQAVPGFERWFGHRSEVDDDLRAAVLR
ncbi:MAG: shikimate dehydrogenase [Shimia sp.]